MAQVPYVSGGFKLSRRRAEIYFDWQNVILNKVLSSGGIRVVT